MNRIKALSVCLALGLASLVYAAGGRAQSNTSPSCDMNQAGTSCCAPGASCCTGGSCCMMKIAK